MKEPSVPVVVTTSSAPLEEPFSLLEIMHVMEAPNILRGRHLQIDYVSCVNVDPDTIDLTISTYSGINVISSGGPIVEQLIELRNQDENDCQARLAAQRVSFRQQLRCEVARVNIKLRLSLFQSAGFLLV